MKTIGTMLLALVLMTGTAFAQFATGGRGGADARTGGGPPPAATGGSGGFDARARAGGGRHGAHVGVGATGGLSTGIGSSRINSAITSQNRGRRSGRFR